MADEEKVEAEAEAQVDAESDAVAESSADGGAQAEEKKEDAAVEANGDEETTAAAAETTESSSATDATEKKGKGTGENKGAKKGEKGEGKDGEPDAKEDGKKKKSKAKKAKVSNKEKRAVVRIQMAWRQRKARMVVYEKAQQVIEKIYDPRLDAYYYYNKKTFASSWVKPAFLGSLDIRDLAPTYTDEQAAIMIQCSFRRMKALRRGRRRLSTVLSKIYDESTGAEYYYNSQTYATAWEKPSMLGKWDIEDYGEGGAALEAEGLGSDAESEESEEGGSGESEEEEEEEEEDGSVDSADQSYLESEASDEDSAMHRDYPRSKMQLLVDEAKDNKQGGLAGMESDEAGATILNLSRLNAHNITSRVYEIDTLTDLDISHNKIPHISEDIGNLTQIMSLKAGFNNLHTLPVELEEMSETLTALDVSHNKISDYPANLYVCNKLMEINLSYNHLEKVPLSVGDLELLKVVREWEVGVGQLKALTKLDLSHNRLIEFPLQLDRCEQLTDLNVSHNNIELIPSFISGCRQLQRLDISHNKLTVLFPEIKTLRGIKYLDASHNQISALTDMRGLTLLTDLYIDNNKLTQLGQELLDLQALTVLHARHNQIRKLSPNIGRLQALRTLYLDHNSLEELPGDLFNINHLRDLSVNDNELDAIPQGLRKCFQLHHLSLARNWINNVDGRELHMLISLKAIDLQDNGCVWFPHQLCDLTGLTSLNMSRNAIPQLPDDLCKMTSLTELDLQRNQIIAIPEAIDKLSKIESLYLQYNHLKDVPPALRNMTHIKRLNFASNLFDVTPGLLSHLTQVVQCNLTRNPLSKVRQTVAKRMKITKPYMTGLEIMEEGVGEEMSLATDNFEAAATQYSKQLAGSGAKTLPITPQYHFGAGCAVVQLSHQNKSRVRRLDAEKELLVEQMEKDKDQTASQALHEAREKRSKRLGEIEDEQLEIREHAGELCEQAEHMLDTGIELLIQARNLGPGLELYYARAQASLASKNPDRAIRDLDHLLAQRKDYEPAMMLRAEARESLGQYPQAHRDCVKASRSKYATRSERQYLEKVRELVDLGMHSVRPAGINSADFQREFEVTPAGTLHRRTIELRHLLVEGESLKRAEIDSRAQKKLVDAQAFERYEDERDDLLAKAHKKRDRYKLTLEKIRSKRMAERRRAEQELRERKEEERRLKELARKQAEERREEHERERMAEAEEEQRKVEAEIKRIAEEEEAQRLKDEAELEELLKLRGKKKKRPGSKGSRPGSKAKSRPGSKGSADGDGSEAGSKPGTAKGKKKKKKKDGEGDDDSKPGTANGSKPGTANGSKPGTANGSKPGTANSSKSGTEDGSKPENAKSGKSSRKGERREKEKADRKAKRESRAGE
eukprot:CAMPEP_0119528726 /NCGR_PEP_ID=MMETSP1344-20130328/42854_1 /TAXON_ID=236787 /ORGANISM="Florenciella parvula, Strain CCMP2471" /LENGTH=1363 /DNA_ID=CAMNT_0007568175 /DNA_START=224 /DNA_END=4315 /DNA_ORIENTATION=-